MTYTVCRRMQSKSKKKKRFEALTSASEDEGREEDEEEEEQQMQHDAGAQHPTANPGKLTSEESIAMMEDIVR